jgi:hypothetical protein
MLQHGMTCCNMLHYAAHRVQHAATRYDMLQHASLRCTQSTTCCNMLHYAAHREQHAATRYDMLQHAAFCGNMRHHAAPSRKDCSSRTSRVWPSEGGRRYLPELSQACRFHVGMTSGGAEHPSGKAQRVLSAARCCALRSTRAHRAGSAVMSALTMCVMKSVASCMSACGYAGAGSPKSLRRRRRAKPSPGADVAVASPVPVPM